MARPDRLPIGPQVANLGSFRGLFGALALVLAAVGLYGLMAYGVSRRTREFGIRIAIGASAGSIVNLVLREAGRLLAAGIAAGLGGAWAIGRVASSMLFRDRADGSGEPDCRGGRTCARGAACRMGSGAAGVAGGRQPGIAVRVNLASLTLGPDRPYTRISWTYVENEIRL
jgi:ABC-type antimicrobial peptide transport system permease subunit